MVSGLLRTGNALGKVHWSPALFLRGASGSWKAVGACLPVPTFGFTAYHHGDKEKSVTVKDHLLHQIACQQGGDPAVFSLESYWSGKSRRSNWKKLKEWHDTHHICHSIEKSGTNYNRFVDFFAGYNKRHCLSHAKQSLNKTGNCICRICHIASEPFGEFARMIQSDSSVSFQHVMHGWKSMP